MSNKDYDVILSSARRHTAPGRLIGAAIIAFLVVALVSPVFVGLIGAPFYELRPFVENSGQVLVGTTPGGAFLVLAGYAGLLLVTLILAHYLHERNISELTGPSAQMRRQFLRTLKGLAPLILVVMILPWEEGPEEIVPHLSVDAWLLWLPLACIAVMIQVGAEEVFFRGYLQSQLIATTGSMLAGVFLSAVFFGFLHVAPGADWGATAFYMLWACLFGLIASDLTIRSGTIGPALALHFVNNAFTLFFSPPENMLSGFGLYNRVGDLADVLSDPLAMGFQILLILLMWLSARLALKR